jgi:DNA-binding IclR family transcriptional regulator
LAEVRLRGYSTDRGEYTPGVSCVAVPVRDHLGRTTAAISVSVPDSRRTKDWEKQVKKALDRAALDLSRDLGFPG